MTEETVGTAAERAVVGMAMNDPAALAEAMSAGLSPAMFDDEQLREAFGRVVAADREGRRHTARAIAVEMPLLAGRLTSVSREAPVAQSVAHYVAEMVEADWSRRAARQLAQLSERMRSRPPFAEGSQRTDVERILRELGDGPEPAGGPRSEREVMVKVLDNLERRIAAPGSTGIPTGLVKLDRVLLGGWHPTWLCVPAARPGKGKTTFAINAMEAAAAAGRWAAFFTVEMPDDQIGEKHLSMTSLVHGSRLRRGDLSDDEQDRIVHGIEQLKDRRVWIDDSTAGDVSEIIARCRRLHRRGKLDIAFVDYLQLLRAPGRFSSRQAELSEITGALKRMAIELKVPVVCLSTINREAEKVERPGMHHLKDSGSIEQDADVVMLLYEDTAKRTWIDVAKNRHGAEGEVQYEADLAVSKFRDTAGA